MEEIRPVTVAVRLGASAGITCFSKETLVLARALLCGGYGRWDSHKSSSPMYSVSNRTLSQSHSEKQASEILNFLSLLRRITHASLGEHIPLSSVGARHWGM